MSAGSGPGSPGLIFALGVPPCTTPRGLILAVVGRPGLPPDPALKGKACARNSRQLAIRPSPEHTFPREPLSLPVQCGHHGSRTVLYRRDRGVTRRPCRPRDVASGVREQRPRSAEQRIKSALTVIAGIDLLIKNPDILREGVSHSIPRPPGQPK